MRKFNLAIVVLVSLVGSGLITSAYPVISSSKSLATQGNIDYNNGHIPPGLALLYSTDFETVTVTDSHHISISIKHFFNYGPPSSPFWMEGYDQFNGITPHSGTRALGLARVNIERNEFILWNWQWDFSNTWYIREWLHFPSDWSIPSGGWEVLFGFGDAKYPPGYPWIGVSAEPTSTPGTFTIYASGSGFYNNYNGPFGTPVKFALPRGQWSEWEFYVDRGTANVANGQLKLWVNGILVLDSGAILPAKSSANSGATLDIYPSDLYGRDSYYNPFNETRWIDDLEIYASTV
jgi:hypothetical protein